MLAKAKSAPLLNRERKKHFRRRLKLFGVLIFIIALLSSGFYLIFISDLPKVRSVEVTGNESVTEEEIINIVNEEILKRSWVSKLMGSANILAWKKEETFQLGDKFPEVAMVTVVRNLTDRKISIKVDEREKFAIWCEGGCFWIDEQGIIFEGAPEVKGSLIRIIRVNSERSLKLGEKPLSDKETEKLVKIVSFLESFSFVTAEMSIEDLEFKEIIVRISNGPRVYFNLLLDPDFGRPVIESLKENGTWAQVDYLDLRVDGRAYYKIK